MSDLVSSLDDEFQVQDPEEECFLLFLNKPDNRDLGFVSRTESTVSVSINSQDLTIHQSPSLLTSTRETGTTGAVLWKVTPLLASWLTHPCNTVVSQRILKPSCTVVELGAGTSGVLALSLAPSVGVYYATDQEYCLKLLRKNIAENYKQSTPANSKTKEKSSSKRTKRAAAETPPASTGNVTVLPLDWQLTEVSSIPEFRTTQVDLIIAADCIYNESLVEPLVDTMVDLSRLNRDETDHSVTLVMVAQELRSPDVLEAFMKAFCAKFRVWRLPDQLYKDCGDGGKGLMEGGGYVVHVGVLK